MEHKAQESLDYIESLEASTLGDLMVGETADKEVSILQNLIDCQLTVEEIEYIQLLLSLEVNIKKCGSTAFVKLEKQKEMWEEEK